ncbi:MAG: type II toxin-antitoxin system MqsA family antitoxin [Acidobacteria bacterium]|nr:type II toxin-antitoxin system MqsA family antitoxin [Acidobacteriota bacterium]
MSPTRNPNPRCAICGGELRDTTITHQVTEGTQVYLFEHVPAQVCQACGEIWIEEAVLQRIDRLAAAPADVQCLRCASS